MTQDQSILMRDLEYSDFVSPVTHRPLTLKAPGTLVDTDGHEFKRDAEHGFWDFLPSSSPLYTREQWEAFQHLIRNFVVSFEQDPTHNVSYDARPDALAFGDFCQYHGNVLDIGCGPHTAPSYIRFRRSAKANYVGVDVLVGAQPKELEFVRAMGEHLPFRDGLFDVTISGTSLLHFVDVVAGLRDALRVTKPHGYSCVWMGIKSKSAPKPASSPAWYKELEVPKGADNPFHYKRYEKDEFLGLIQKAGGKVVELVELPVDEWRTNLFLRVVKGN